MEKYTIGGLKQLIATSEDFSAIQDYFFSISEHNRAAFNGTPSKNKPLKQFCMMILGIVTGNKDVIMTNMTMIEVRNRCFWHGGSHTNMRGVHVSFCYFSDLDRGMICVMRDNGETTYARITVKPVSDENAKADSFSMN